MAPQIQPESLARMAAALRKTPRNRCWTTTRATRLILNLIIIIIIIFVIVIITLVYRYSPVYTNSLRFTTFSNMFNVR